MKVIFGKEIAKELEQRLTLLELDTFFQPGLAEPVTAYAVLDNDSVPLEEIPYLDKTLKLHNTMLLEYRRRNWNYCEQALEHLVGKWNGEIDSFYHEFKSRIDTLKNASLSDDWAGILINNSC